MYAIKHNPKLSNPNELALKEVEKYDEIKKIAEHRKQDKFALVRSVNDYEEDIKGLKRLLEKGWITEVQYKQKVKETEEQHKKVVQLQFSKKPKNAEMILAEKKMTVEELRKKINYTEEQRQKHKEKKKQKDKERRNRQGNERKRKDLEWKRALIKNSKHGLSEDQITFIQEHAEKNCCTFYEARKELVGDT